MALQKKLKLGVDIGGSKIRMVLWDGSKVLERWETKKVTPETLRQGISRFNVSKVGIGVPGILDFKTGKILKCPNLASFEGLNLKRIFKKDIRLDNDVNCFLLAEAKVGAAKGYKNALAVAFGTGIGGGVMVHGKIYRGSCGSAGEFGHIVIDHGQTWEELYQKNRGNPKKQAKLNAQGIANLINIFDPEIIILGGAAAKIPQKALIEKYVVSPLAKKTKIVLSKLGEDAAAIGAALLH